MERLYQVTYSIMVICFSGCVLGATPAQEPCSLVVRALTPSGERPKVPISVREGNGRFEEKYQDGDDVGFCDLGILPVTVTVGSDSMCDQVIIQGVQVSIDETHLLRVTYDPEGCGERIPPPLPACVVLFRVADLDGNWVPGALIRVTNPAPAEQFADKHGRVLFEVRVGVTFRANVSKAGWRSQDITWTCPDSDPHERVVKLEKR